jgi:FimV-like protein
VIVQLAALPPAAALERERTAPAKGESPSALPRIDTGAGAYRVRPGDTLSRIVRRAGATSEADALRMMIAVYRGNPLAFDRNINRLRRNALLAMPSVAAISAMDATQARRDVAQHMNAWRHAAGGRPTSPTVNDVADVPGSTTIPFAGTPESISNPEPAATPDPAATPEPIANAVPGPATPGAEPVARATPRAPVSTPQPIASLDAAPPAPAVGAVRPVPRSARSVVGPGARLFVALSLLVVLPLLGLALLRLRRPRSVAPARPEVEPAQAMAAQAPEQTNELPQVTWHDSDQVRGGTVEMPTVQLPAAGIAAASADTGATAQIPGTTLRMPGVDLDDSADDTILMANAGGETTTTVPVDMETVVLEGMLDDDALLEATARGTRLAVAQGTVLDYNLVDLDAGDEHVHLPSDLHDRTNFVERRKNVVDALLAALQRDPTRNDLRVKLLETYFAQAAVNRRAFAEHVRSQACAPGTLSKEDWQKITLMKQELGLDLELPTDLSGDDLANCA